MFVGSLMRHGAITALAQLVLKLTVPGVPDLYQGGELWDFSLVDPDNRRPVDWNVRISLLAKLDGMQPRDLAADWQDRREKAVRNPSPAGAAPRSSPTFRRRQLPAG